MRFFWILALVAGALAIDQVFDDFDVDAYAEDATSRRGLVDCLLDEGECDPFAKHMRDNLPEVLRTACGICNPKQATLYRKLTIVVSQLYPEEYKRMEQKYDPESQYLLAYRRFVAMEGVA